VDPLLEQRLRCDIVEVGRRLYQRALIGGNEGNLSVRVGDTLLVTPAGVCKGFLDPTIIVRTDLAGKPVDGGRASTEILMHTAIYRRRPDVTAVVHAHPPTATAFAVANIPLDRPLIAEAVVTLGEVPVIPYGMPSTEQLAQHVGEAMCGAHAILMANHGALAVGDSIWRAWERMETLEQLAKIALTTKLLGRDTVLPAGEVQRLVAARPGAGYPEPVCRTGSDATAAPAPPPGGTRRPDDGETLTLTRAELVRLVSDAVKRFSGPGGLT
jgi:L-fuculose-phosphate aldolase